jgi:parallel beta-helix repeat protein
MGQYVGTGYDASITFNADDIVISGFTINCYGAITIFGNHVILMGNTISNYEGNWMRVNGDYVTISNNTLNVVTDVQGSYSGVSANTGRGSIIISDWGSYNSVFYNNMSGSIGSATLSSSNLYYENIVQNGDGISANLNDLVYNNTVIGCDHGIYMITGSNNVIIGNTLINNFGPALANNGYVMGSLARCGLNNTFSANYVANNALGIFVDTYNEWHGGNITVYNNDFINNTHQAQVTVSNSSTFWNYEQSPPWSDYWNTTDSGNYWSNYNGTDANGDGIGDSPYLVCSNESDYKPLMNPFNISSINIQLPSWAVVSLPNPLSTPSFPPQPSPSPSPSPNSTPSPSPSPNPSSSPSPSPAQEPFPTLAATVVSGASAIAISVGVLLYFKKRKH